MFVFGHVRRDRDACIAFGDRRRCTVHCSLFTVQCSLFTVHRSPLTAHRSFGRRRLAEVNAPLTIPYFCPMKKQWFLVFVIAGMIGCKRADKKENYKSSFFPVLPFIQSQVAHVDTSIYPIIRIDYIDSVRSDTTHIHREQFRALAKDFLEIPDVTQKEFRKRFVEEPIYDETMNRAILSYKPVDPEKETLKKQEVLITPNQGQGDKVNSIILTIVISNKDGYLEKNMLWQVDQYFQVATISQKPGQPETTSVMKVSWNESKEE
jgi:hypothetical protein